MLYISMTVFEPGHTAAVLSSIRYISRMQLRSFLPQRNRFSFSRKLNRDGNSTKKQISSMLRTWKKKNLAIFCYVRQVTSSGSLANRNNLMGGVKLILMQLSSKTDYSTAYLVKSYLVSGSTRSEKKVKKTLCKQEFRYKSTQA